MKEIAKVHGSTFRVLLLDPDSFRYESFLKENSITYAKVEGNFGKLSYDNHPDLTFHKLAAQRILELFARTE